MGGPLPVTLASSYAELLNDNTAEIDWATSMENNCSKYYVQRSEDGNTFTTVETVAGHGTTTIAHTYSTKDDISSVTSSVVYYRLGQVDVGGQINYSKIVAVKLNNKLAEFSVMPNPFTSYVNINLQWDKSEVASAKVFNVVGSQLIAKDIQLTKGLNYISMTELAQLPAGTYIIALTTSTGNIIKKVTKE